MKHEIGSIKNQLQTLVQNKYGRCDELLMDSGILDSLKAVELAIEAGDLFGVDTNGLKLKDMATLTSLSEAIFNSQPQ